ncbi:MAG: hypothetical protein A2Y13_04935 [Planctomycetes bacterium GWC2_45_44]|nr:MAG: hypothetical protein A2Y13_04935 [Planctomycetes bacterium GWC2_45_44]
MLQLAERPVSHLELVKWCFLLATETPSKGGDSFYQFVPYQYGPFSFGLFQEIGKLIEGGLVRQPDTKSWNATGHYDCTEDIKSQLRSDIFDIVKNYGKWKVDDVVDYIYTKNPYFTINSRIKKLMSRPIGKPAIYTAGYEGLQIDGFMDMLIKNGIVHMLDIRRNPVARRYGFHKKTLDRISQSLEVKYSHIPELGIASEDRRHLESPEDYQKLFKAYEKSLLGSSDKLDELASLMATQPCVLICMENDPAFCHRSILAKVLAKKTGLPVQHLRGNEWQLNMCQQKS